MQEHFEKWRKRSAKRLKSLDKDCHPKQVIHELSEDLLSHYEGQPLVDPYDVYQHLMDYCAETMQDDLYLVAADGWKKAETYRILVKNKKGEEKDKGWACDLVPKELVVNRYFPKEKQALSDKQAELEALIAQQDELEEEHSGEGGALSSVGNKPDAQSAWGEEIELVWQSLIPKTHKQYADAVATVNENFARHAQLKIDPAIRALKNTKGNVMKTAINKRIKDATGKELALLKDYVSNESSIKESKKVARELLESATETITKRME